MLDNNSFNSKGKHQIENNKDLSRCVTWDWHSPDEIFVELGEQKKVLTVWQTFVFYYADNFHNMNEIINCSRGNDSSAENAALELLKMGAIVYGGNAHHIPYKYYVAMSEYDCEHEKDWDV